MTDDLFLKMSAQLESALAERDAAREQFRELHAYLSAVSNCATDGANWRQIVDAIVANASAERDQLRQRAWELAESFGKQRDNYIRLSEAVMGGGGASTSEWRDPIEVAKQLHERASELDRDNSNL